MLLLEAELDGVQPVRAGQALDRRDRAALGLDREVRAGLDRRAVDEDGAGAAAGRVAADVDPGEPEPAQEVHEQQARLDLGRAPGPVHGERQRQGRLRLLGGQGHASSFRSISSMTPSIVSSPAK